MSYRFLHRLTPAALGALLCLSAFPAFAEDPYVEPVVTRYAAGNVPAAEVVADLFSHFGLTYRSRGALPERKISLNLARLPLSEALERVAAEAGCSVRVRQAGDVYVLEWKALPSMPAPPTRPAPASGAMPAPEKPLAAPVLPMLFPVAGATRWSDTYNLEPSTGRRRHQGQDLMAPKLTPLVAVWDGVVTLTTKNGHNMLRLLGDHGYLAWYMHINNDTPGTDDGLGGPDYAWAPGLKSGDRVVAGQLVAWVGDSGNAETTAPHCHFEFHGPDGYFNPAPSLQAARKLEAPLVVAPTLEERLEPGEVRWEGVVREFQADSGLAVLDLLATSEPEGRLVSVRSPRRQWIRLNEARWLSAEPAALSPGLRLTVLGKPGEEGRAAEGRLVLAAPVGTRTASGR